MGSQIYINSYPRIQKSINLIPAVFNLLFLIKYRPFKESKIAISNIAAEISLIFVLISVLILPVEANNFKEMLIEYIVVYSILLCMGFQFLISMYSFFEFFISKYKQYLESKIKIAPAFSNSKLR